MHKTILESLLTSRISYDQLHVSNVTYSRAISRLQNKPIAAAVDDFLAPTQSSRSRWSSAYFSVDFSPPLIKILDLFFQFLKFFLHNSKFLLFFLLFLLCFIYCSYFNYKYNIKQKKIVQEKSADFGKNKSTVSRR